MKTLGEGTLICCPNNATAEPCSQSQNQRQRHSFNVLNPIKLRQTINPNQTKSYQLKIQNEYILSWYNLFLSVFPRQTQTSPPKHGRSVVQSCKH